MKTTILYSTLRFHSPELEVASSQDSTSTVYHGRKRKCRYQSYTAENAHIQSLLSRNMSGTLRKRKQSPGRRAPPQPDWTKTTTTSANASANGAPSELVSIYWREKGAWMNATLRDLFMSCRLWSAPASLMPILLTAFLVQAVSPAYNSFHRVPEIPVVNAWLGLNWLNFDVLDLVLAILGGVATHLAANLINTYFDYFNGIDTKATADDRTLVDGKAIPDTVATLAIVCLTISGAICGYYATMIGTPFLTVAVSGVLLGILYTAAPLQLKYKGLGGITVFVCFGPLVMSGAALILLHRSEMQCEALSCVPGSLYVLSCAVGALTAAILHANNTRDIVPDAARGAASIAQRLSFRSNLTVYTLLLGTAYVVAAIGIMMVYVEQSIKYNSSAARDLKSLPVIGQAALAVSTAFRVHLRHMHKIVLMACSMATSSTEFVSDMALALILSTLRRDGLLKIGAGQLMLLIPLPWTLQLIRRFREKLLRTLPQFTAQFEVLFVCAVGCSFLTLGSLATLFLGILYTLGAVNNFLMWHHISELVHAKMNNFYKCIFPGKQLARVISFSSAGAATVTQFILSLGFMLHVYQRECAWGLFFWTLLVSVITHDFWNSGSGEFDDSSGEYVDVPDYAPSRANGTLYSAAELDSDNVGAATPSRNKTDGAYGRSKRSRSKTSSRRKYSSDMETLHPETSTPNEVLWDASIAVKKDAVNLVPVFSRAFDNQFVHFFKNIGMAGGLLVFLAATGEYEF
eukprot:gb/GECG01016592.1/.p1 GENE.gb/GECG01016592.1/~~gb/GECG01016592.1/.p1  ORF type:complete len:745 (+),score=45.02 gb/GECG01016592.1/:1-2235(+)